MMLTKEQQASISNYRRLGIEITELDTTKIKIKQVSLINGYILNNKQLYEKAKEIFPERHIIPVVYTLNCDEINLAWIQQKMTEFDINQKDLVKQLAMKKSYLGILFSEKTPLTIKTKAAFFYYFLSYELNSYLRK